MVQIKLLKVMALLGAGDRVASENMYAVIQQVRVRLQNSISGSQTFKASEPAHLRVHVCVCAKDDIRVCVRVFFTCFVRGILSMLQTHGAV